MTTGTKRACRRLAAAAAIACTTLSARHAAANGRFPSAGQIVVDPGDGNHLLVRTTYGVLSTTTAGEPWTWICEQAIGFSDQQDPPMAFTGDSTVLAGLVTGLRLSSDAGCGWTGAAGLEDRFVVDVSASKGDGQTAVALAIASAGATVVTELWTSTNAGHTWKKGGALPDGFFGLTVDIAPSQPKRLWLSGRYGKPDYPGVLERSDDGGATWERFDIPGSDDQSLPYIGAVDPSDPDVVYVRLDGEPDDTLVVTRDGGASFTPALTMGSMLAFAVSPDGATVLAGGDKDGVHRAAAKDLAFDKVSDVGIKCLAWAESGLWACADEFRDAFTVGTSTDQGATWQPRAHLTRLCGPLDCPASSGVTTLCTDQWGAVKLTLKTEPCGASSSSSGGAAAPGDGCGCSAPGRAAGAAAWSALGALWLLSRRRRAGRRGCR